MSESTDGDEEKMVQVAVEVPESVRDSAKANLPYGGMTQVIREELNRVAFGEEMGQRSRLKSRLEDVREERDKLQRERRELNAKIENLNDQAKDTEQKLNSLETREDRYEAKLESLEYRLRVKDHPMDPKHPEVTNLVAEVNKSPEGVVKDLKHRNPDVPDMAFEDFGGGFHPPDREQAELNSVSTEESYGGDGEVLPFEKRKEKYRPRDPDTDN